jgi:prepilin-type processing-associated H-X9-DG protein/prepilin-type N-terminal cleavage/methylation domain-containing protein
MQKSRPAGVRSAFTLVELLVVIGIIALLISILLPALNKARDKARAVQCMSNMRQLYLFSAMFAQDNKGHLPRGGAFWSSPTAPGVDEYVVWGQPSANAYGRASFESGALWKYIGGKEARAQLIFCPGDNGEPAQANGQFYPNRNFSYSVNAELVVPTDIVRGGGTKYMPGVRLGTIKRAAEKIMWWEEQGPNDTYCVEPLGNGDDLPSGRHAGQKFINAQRTLAKNTPEWNRWSEYGRGNFAFFDGHVEVLSPGNIFARPTYYKPLNQ